MDRRNRQTTHAVLCAEEAIGGAPFLVLNADDYYGEAAFKAAYDVLAAGENDCCYMMGFHVGNTLSDSGGVTRGICQVNDEGYLTGIVETKGVEKHNGGIRIPDGEGWKYLDPETPVSMNMWGLNGEFMRLIRENFPVFLEEAKVGKPLTQEYLLPTTVAHLIDMGLITVKVLPTPDTWFGVTYAEDKPLVVGALKAMTEAGKYPDGLWK